jgi:hypothetical protein
MTTRSPCLGAGRAPRWMIVGAILLVAVFGAALVYHMLIKPMTSAAGGDRAARGGAMRGPSTSDLFTQQGGASLLYFYMDGCGWCEKFNPEWSAFDRQYRAALDAAHVKAEKVNGSSDPRATKHGVTGFPTIVLVTADGAAHRYEGERTAAALAAFVHGEVPAFVA